MKFLELHLRAFGTFTDRRLDLSGGHEGLHVIFGANEAGKSSLLRALRALLYGVPERTQDDFLHDKKDLRIGGHFRAANGEELYCYRRKGRKNTLHDPDDQVIPDEHLSRLLGGVTEGMFERLFGIDHESLATGGQALLAERGREAEALFGAGLGGAAIHEILNRFDEEAKNLFLARGQKPEINAEIKQFTEIKRQLREASLSTHHWEEIRKTVEGTRQQMAEMEQQQMKVEHQRNRLERIRRILPNLAKRERLREQITELGTVPTLAADFGARRKEAMEKYRLAMAARDAAHQRISALRDKAAKLDVSEVLLAAADTIDALYARLGSHRKAAQDRSQLVIRCGDLENRAQRRLAVIRPDLPWIEVDSLRPLLGKQRRVAELGGRREALESAVKNITHQQLETGRKLSAKQSDLAQLPDIPPLDNLRRAVESSRRVGELDSEIDQTAARLKQQQKDCKQSLAALGLWQQSLAELCSVPLPTGELVQQFREDLQGLENDRRQFKKALADAQTEQQRIEESLRALQLAGTVPSEMELEQIRTRRDNGWSLLRRQWLESEDIAVEGHDYALDEALPDVFETAMMNADEVADRLRREAQRVHEKATAQAKLETSHKRVATAEEALKELEIECQHFHQRWHQLWKSCDVIPQSPREMHTWIEKVLQLKAQAEESDQQQARLDHQCQIRERHIQILFEALVVLGETVTKANKNDRLETMLSDTETRLNILENTAKRRALLAENIVELDESVGAFANKRQLAETEWRNWCHDWVALMCEMGFSEDTRHGEVADNLQTIAEILKQVDEGNDLQKRIDDIDEDAKKFQGDARERLAILASDLLTLPVEDAVSQLHARLGQQREIKSQLNTLQEQQRKEETGERETDIAIGAANKILTELCQQANCEAPDELHAVEQHYLEYQQLTRQLREIENELINSGGGSSLKTLEAEVSGVDYDKIEVDLQVINTRLEQELRPRWKELLEQKVNAERDFNTMTGSDAALRLAEEAQQKLSSLRTLAERYVRARLAGRILRDEIEHFRRQHRDPILTRASAYFRKLTCESFLAVETDFDDSDQPVLVGVRENKDRLRVEAMSTGTRDQLYLALRLATLDHYLDSSEPLPFIVDDILVQFDDHRARSTLDALADFSKKTQVILFTHHNRIIEQVNQLDGVNERIFIHNLG